MTSTLTHEEVEAALEEGLLPMPVEQQMLRQRWLDLNEEKKALAAKMDAVRDELGAALVEMGAQAFTIDGAAKVRLSEVITQSVDTSKWKNQDPEDYKAHFARFPKVTKTERVTIK